MDLAKGSVGVEQSLRGKTPDRSDRLDLEQRARPASAAIGQVFQQCVGLWLGNQELEERRRVEKMHRLEAVGALLVDVVRAQERVNPGGRRTPRELVDEELLPRLGLVEPAKG